MGSEPKMQITNFYPLVVDEILETIEICVFDFSLTDCRPVGCSGEDGVCTYKDLNTSRPWYIPPICANNKDSTRNARIILFMVGPVLCEWGRFCWEFLRRFTRKHHISARVGSRLLI